MPRKWNYLKDRPDNPLSPAEQELLSRQVKANAEAANEEHQRGSFEAGSQRLYNFDWEVQIKAWAKDGTEYTGTFTLNAGTPFEAREYAISRIRAQMSKDGRGLALAHADVVRLNSQ